MGIITDRAKSNTNGTKTKVICCVQKCEFSKLPGSPWFIEHIGDIMGWQPVAVESHCWPRLRVLESSA